jgi:c-di-GMP-binding flagellar brake protein YcgR
MEQARPMGQQRAAERFHNRSRIFFSSIEGTVDGEGTIADLSKTGCRVESDTQPAKGLELKLELFLLDYSWPMKVDRAVVRWIKGRTFGLEFLNVQSAQRDRLVRLIMKLKQDIGH